MKQVKGKLVTEEYLDKRLGEFKVEFRDEFTVYLDRRLDLFRDEIKESTNEVVKKGLRSLDEKLDWLIGAYKKFEVEHNLLGSRVSKYDDRLDIVEKKLHIKTRN